MKNIESPSGPSMYKTPISYAFGQQNLKNASSTDNQFIFERKVPATYQTTA